MNYEIELKLKELLKAKGYTQLKLSEISGVRQSAISDLVRGSRTVINFEHLAKISEALEIITIDEIIDFKKEDKMDKQYFLVGTMYDGTEEHLPEWIENNIWKLGWEEEGGEEKAQYIRLKKIWNQIRVGDVLIAKSKRIRKDESPQIRIKAVATVVSKEEDGHTVNVKWGRQLSEDLFYPINAPQTMHIIENEIGEDILTKVATL